MWNSDWRMDYRDTYCECGNCRTCGKCENTNKNMETRNERDTRNDVSDACNVAVPMLSAGRARLDYEGLTLYTMIIHSENFAGILNQITAVFTRRQVNIESLNVCASSTPGVHKYTITCYTTEKMAEMLIKQIEKKIDVLKADYFTDDEIFILEACLLKINTSMMLDNKEVSRIVRRHGARIVEVNPTYSIVEKKGITSEILSLFGQLNELGAVLQFVRSGRIAVTKSKVEHLDRYMEERLHEQ